MDRKSSKSYKSCKSRPSRNGRKFNRPRNRYEIEKNEDIGSKRRVSASKRKISQDTECDVNLNINYKILNFFSVFAVLSNYISCKKCGGDINFTERSVRGLGFKLVVNCGKCDPVSIDSCPLIDNAYEINRRFIFAMKLIGVGLVGAQRFCAFMDLPRPMFHSFYDRVVKQIRDAAKTCCDIVLSKAAKEEVEETSKQLNSEIIPGISVSGDGSWKKRGFKSLFGISSVIGYYTGKIVDVAMRSSYCKSCAQMNPKKGTIEYDDWLQKHSEVCRINHNNSSGQMEVDGIKEMFQRSESLHNVKYINYIGDGDTKTYKNICDAKPYGDVMIVKKECINHVQKRMGSRLRAIKKQRTTAGKTLGGKGRLTDKLINELTKYYGLAIRRNVTNIGDMYNAIWQTFYHKFSSSENPQHFLCPEGADSWCKFQKAVSTNSLESFIEKPPLPEDIAELLLPIYEDLSDSRLLERCVGGFTQNNNESFNALVWQIAPKSNSSCSVIVEIALYISAITFNEGALATLKIMDLLGIKIGSTLYSYCTDRDSNRIKAAEDRMEKVNKKIKKLKKTPRDEEEEPSYGPGLDSLI